MAINGSYKVEGLQALGQRMRGLSDEMAFKVARSSTNAGAQAIRKLAVQKAPEAPSNVSPKVPPGNLKKQIRTKYVKESHLTSEHIVFVRSGKKAFNASRYGSIQEFGSVKQSAQPWFRPAFDQGKENAAHVMKERLLAAIKKAEAGK